MLVKLTHKQLLQRLDFFTSPSKMDFYEFSDLSLLYTITTPPSPKLLQTSPSRRD